MKQVVQLAAGRPTKIPETPEEFQAAQQFRSSMLGATAGLKAYAPAGKDYESRLKGLKDEGERLPHYGDADIAAAVVRMWDEREALEKDSKGRAIVPGAGVGQKKNVEAIREALANGDTAHATRLARSVATALQSPLKPEERRQKINDFLAALVRLDPDAANDPNKQRQLAQAMGVLDFIEGIEPGTLKFAGEDLEKRWQAAMSRVMQGGKLSPGAQKLAYGELVALARLTGRKVTVTPKELFALSPELALKMKREQKLFDFKVQEHQWKVAERPIRMAMLDKGLKMLDLSIENKKLTNKNLKTGKPGDKWWRSATFTKLKDAHNNAISAYQSHLTRSKLVEGDFDPNRPGGGPEERAAARLYQNIEKTRKDMDGFIQRNGMDPGTIERMGEGEMLTPEGLAKTQPPKTPLPTKPGGRKPLNQMSPDEVAAAFAAAIKKRSGAK
jgi:transcriptional regulator with XRE-family HTH domain